MMTRLFASLALLVAATTTASADSYDATQPAPQAARYVGLTTSGGVSSSLFRLGVGVEGGHRIGAVPWFLHAQVETGISGALFTQGRYTAMRLGVETRRCAGYATQLCGFVGADAGAMHDAFTVTPWGEGEEMSGSTVMMMVVPRAGAEVGTAVRARAIVEAPMYGGDGAEYGVNVSLGLAYAF